MTYIIHADGGARGNPGPAAYGVIIDSDDGKRVMESGEPLGVLTNNQAEYQGVIAAFTWFLDHQKKLSPSPSTVRILLDSELLVNQLAGRFRIKSFELRRLALIVKSLERQLRIPVQYVHVRREENREADRKVNDALDASAGKISPN